MAKYISIPTADASVPNVILNADTITSVIYNITTRVDVWVSNTRYRFTTSTNGADDLVVALNNAILAQNGPSLVQVVLPTGVTVTGAPAITFNA